MNTQQFPRRWSTLVVLGAVAATSFISVGRAQGTVRTGERYAQIEDDRYRVRVVGVVTREIRDDEFRMRGDDGTNYRVSVRRSDNARVVVGDRIEVTGRMDGNTLIARRITQLGINPNGGGSQTIQRGVVVSRVNDTTMEIRADDGRFHRIRSRNGNLGRFNINDRVEARGYFDADRIFVADSVVLVRDGDGETGDRLTRRGTIVNIVDAAVFEMQGEDGIAYRVQAPFRGQRSTAPVVRVGDRVQVRGYFDRDRILIAESVQLLNGSGGDGGYGERVTRRGTIVNIVDAAVFEMRGDDGVAYRVQATFRGQRSTAPVVRQGDRVEVSGYFDPDRIIIAENLRLLSKGDGGDTGDTGERVTRRGTVVNIVDAFTFEMQGEDGTAYRMRMRNQPSQRISIGDRVEVRGYFDQDRIIVTDSVRILGRGDTGGNVGERVTRRGVAVNIVDIYTFEIRGDDGPFYRMRMRNNERHRVNVGDRVEVRGYFDPDRIIITDSVQILGRGTVGSGGSEGPDGSQANFTGTILRADRVLMLWVLQVRTDDGRQYQVSYSGQNTFVANDRVRVIGTFRRGTVVATTISRL